MNERIQELSDKAKKSVPHGLSVDKWIETYNEKFAELIIRDCIDCVDGYTKPRTYGTHYEAVEQIKANFGIEDENQNS